MALNDLTLMINMVLKDSGKSELCVVGYSLVNILSNHYYRIFKYKENKNISLFYLRVR